MSIALFFVLAVVAAAAIVQPLLPGSRASYPLPSGRGQSRAVRPPSRVTSSQGAKCPGCGAPVQPDDRYCVRCGATLGEVHMPVCAACGTVLSEDDQFCRKCGTRVTTTEAQQ